DLRDIVSEFAPHAPGLCLEAFEILVAERRRIFGERDRALRMFSALDAEDRGYLDLRSFRNLCAATCRPAANRSTEIFYDMDRSKSGSVTFSDFEAYLAGP
ncbi:unnamed protein product, partial [Polarella glacialis]